MSVVVRWLEVADVDLAPLRELLSEDELAAAERMSDAPLHVSARALVRLALSDARPHVAPRDWRFARAPAGKPFVTGPESTPPCFSLSHTAGLAVVAVAETAVGVDVEALSRGPQVLDTVLRAFAPSELAALRALPETDQPRRAVELWTVKEAYLKALGTGISRHLDRFAVRPSDTPDARQTWTVDESSAWRIAMREVAGRWLVATAASPKEPIAFAQGDETGGDHVR